MSNFKKYYNMFLDNLIKKEKYKITFDDNAEIVCIPFCGSFVTPGDDTEFSLLVEEGNKKETINKKFSSIKKVEKYIK